jgi:hypothetical protein
VLVVEVPGDRYPERRKAVDAQAAGLAPDVPSVLEHEAGDDQPP